ncbi:agenet domain-containing protein/bromo-adjacent-like proteiny (BAH) domain-containing protein [Forsythia ovata]|uniref:Agenet domain-containing protein/bromo-adjacent-like proteiny (BAH) domain-containing protein n=1 Tax=Forsythia ovata TaxID=205694 RepID=A0ABD1QBC0_9LAMI
MSANNHVLMAWEERIISQEKGNRVVHYYLKDSNANSVLAVVGTERSVRHMIYVVTEDFIRVYGCTRTVHVGTKWRARRDVVEWLSSIVSRGEPISTNSNPQILQLKQSLESSGISMASFSNCLIRRGDEEAFQIQVSRKFNVRNPDIEWKGDAWICSKQLKHYPGFCRNGTEIAVPSFVLIMGEEESRYLGYLEDLYEDKKGEKLVNVQWFQYKEEVIGLIPHVDAHPREVFITPHKQEISVECIDSLAAVLTPNHFQKCSAHSMQGLSFGIFMCHREFKNDKVNPFSLSKLRGYYNQPILSHLNSSFSGTRNEGYKQSEEVAKCGPPIRRLKIKMSSKGPISIDLVGPAAQFQLLSNVNANIELLCQDSGMRGCWFRCKILQSLEKRIRVQYYDVLDVDGPAKLEEWYPASRVATPDKMGMRCAGRLTVRPWPYEEDSSDSSFVVGAAVDAWWGDGWWEGVVIGCDTVEKDNHQVYFPGENKFLTIPRKKMRTSRDWIDNKWVDIKAKPDILSFLSSTFIPGVNLPSFPTLTGPSKPNCKVLTFSKCEGSEDKLQLSDSVTSICPCPKGAEGLNMRNRLIIKDDEDRVHTLAHAANKGKAVNQ